MPPGTPFRQKTPGGPLVVYPQFLNRSPVGGQVLHGTAFRAETGINSTFSFLFLFVLFLVRPRKRTKKNGAVRHGAGFSANRLTGEYRRLCPTCEKGYTKPRCWTDQRGKTPISPPVAPGAKCAIGRDLPSSHGKGERRLADGLGLQSCRDGIFLSIRVSMDDRQGDTLLLLPLSLWERGLGGEGLGSGGEVPLSADR